MQVTLLIDVSLLMAEHLRYPKHVLRDPAESKSPKCSNYGLEPVRMIINFIIIKSKRGNPKLIS